MNRSRTQGSRVREAVYIIGGKWCGSSGLVGDTFVIGLERETVDECVAVVSGGERWFGVADDGSGTGGDGEWALRVVGIGGEVGKERRDGDEDG